MRGKFLGSFCAAILAVSGVAAGGQDDVFDPADYQLVFKGKDLLEDSCYLGVVSMEDTDDGGYRAIVETSFGHGDSKPGQIVVAPLTATRLIGENLDLGSSITVLVDSEADIKSATAYVVRWQHDDHTDRSYCGNLSEHTGPIDDHGHDDHGHDDHGHGHDH